MKPARPLRLAQIDCRPFGRTAVAAFALMALTAGCAFALAACVAVPVDLRTGQPIAWPQASITPPAGQATQIAPPVAPGPPAAVIYTGRLYPINEVANRAGMLTAVVTDGHGGRGTFSLNYLGDAMQGEASRVDRIAQTSCGSRNAVHCTEESKGIELVFSKASRSYNHLEH